MTVSRRTGALKQRHDDSVIGWQPVFRCCCIFSPSAAPRHFCSRTYKLLAENSTSFLLNISNMEHLNIIQIYLFHH